MKQIAGLHQYQQEHMPLQKTDRTDHRAGENNAETILFWLAKSQSHPNGVGNDKILLMTLLLYDFSYLTGSGIAGGSKMEGREPETINSASSGNNSVSKSIFCLQLKENHYRIWRRSPIHIYKKLYLCKSYLAYTIFKI